MKTIDTNALFAIIYMIRSTETRMPAKTPHQGCRSMNYLITGFVLTAEQRKKISRILTEWFIGSVLKLTHK